MKLLIWLVVVLAIVVWLQRAKKNLVRRAQDAAAAAAARAGTNDQAAGAPDRPMQVIEQMVQCAQCGMHFPASEALRGSAANAVFCCDEHRTLYAQQGGTRDHD
jgi:uncharacterized protein